MTPKPFWKDYGIPEEHAVPEGEYIFGWPDPKASKASRTIIYNLHVIHNMQEEILRRLDRQETLVAAATRTHNPANRGNEILPSDASAAVLPMVAPTVPVEQYLEPAAKATQVAVSSSPPTQELPPLIRRFPKPDKGVELLFSGDHQQPSQEPDTETMAPSDSVMADLAGLMIEPSATVIKASSTPPATLPGHDDQPVGVLVSESRAIDRIQDLLGDNNTSISSRQKPEKEHVKTVAPTAQGASRNPKPAMPQAAKPRTSSALFRGPVTAESITIVGPPSVMAPGSRLPRAYDLTRATPPRPQLPPEAEQPDWMHKSATDVIKERQQQTRSAPVRAQAPAKPSSKGKGKEREGSTIGQQAPPTTAPTTTPAGFRQWHAAQAQHKSAEESTKGKGKMYGGDFW